jgi:hypothetical protein
MALDAAHRTSIYLKLLPLLGDDDVNALMSEFPSVEAEELVTKDFLRAELAVLRGDLEAQMGALRLELAQVQATLTMRLGGAIAAATVLLGGVGLLS